MNMYLYVGSTCAHMKFRVEPQGLFFFFLTDPLTPEHKKRSPQFAAIYWN